MNSQDFRNLQEAYLDVYQEEVLDEVRGGGEIDPVSDIPGIGLRGARSPRDAGLQMSPLKRAQLRKTALEKRGTPEATKRASDMNKNFIRPTEKAVNRALLAATNARHAEKTRLQALNNSYELFDVILEYLIIEGYADTNENALVIMANMSEDWRESILLDEYEDEKLLNARKKSISRLNAAKDAEDNQADGDYENSVDPSNPTLKISVAGRSTKITNSNKGKSGYMEVPTDYHARKRRASGR